MRAVLKRLSENRFRISTQLYAGIWAAVALTMAAGMVGWFSFNRVGEAQNVVNDDTLPEMATAFRVAQFSSNLVDAAPRLATAISQKELVDIAAGIAATNDSFVEQLDELEKETGDTEQYQQLRIYSESLISNIAAIYNDKVELFGLATDKEDIQDGLATVRVRLDSIMLPVLAAQLLATALGLSDSSEVEPLRGLFKATIDEIGVGLGNLNEFEQREDLQQFFSQLSTLGLGTNGGFNLVARELGLLDRQNELLENNRVLALNMVNEIDVFVNSARERADGATLASDQAIRTGRTLLLFTSIVSVAGTALMAWLFVGRVLLRRLSHLSNRMLNMAKGDLETQVTISAAQPSIARSHPLTPAM